MTTDQVQAKKGTLIAQRDQLVANLNMTLGAIAICDEFLQEEELRRASLLKSAVTEISYVVTDEQSAAAE